ncbi:hypothetical protein MKX08_000869 [Trichoderma sp. CBMAI-0020]|nr:hypothetical protein MKX08_000869 [Trichoderma sp. CBMAI-0020]
MSLSNSKRKYLIWGQAHKSERENCHQLMALHYAASSSMPVLSRSRKRGRAMLGSSLITIFHGVALRARDLDVECDENAKREGQKLRHKVTVRQGAAR